MLAVDVPLGKVLEVPAGGEASITVKVTRTPGNERQIEVNPTGIPKDSLIRTGPTWIQIGKTEGKITVKAEAWAPVGYGVNLVLQGTAPFQDEKKPPEGKDAKDVMMAQYAPAVPIQVVAATAKPRRPEETK